MEAIALVAGLAVLQVFVFAFSVGKARVTYEIDAPATSGSADFERIFRVHQNTIEQLVIFLPGLWMFGYYVDANVGAAVRRCVHYFALQCTRARTQRTRNRAARVLPLVH